MQFGIFLIPFLFFYGRRVFFEMKKEFGKDEVSLEAEKIFFFINPFFILFGKVEFFFLNLRNVKAFVTSWIEPQKKISWLPPPNKVFITRGFLKNGELIFYEKSKFPNSKLEVHNIELDNFNLDLAYPLQLFFFTKKGSLNLGKGHLKTELCFPKQGFLKIQDIKWSDLINHGGISIQGLGGEINLYANYKHNERKTLFRGIFGKKEKLDFDDTKSQRFAFQFWIPWNKEFYLPLDLGLYKLFYLIFKNTLVSGVIQIAVISILDLLNKTLKTDENN